MDCSDVTFQPHIAGIGDLDMHKKLSGDVINSLPLFHYEGRISLARSSGEVEAAIMRLSKEKLLGFDTETPPSFRKGKTYPPALVQLAGEHEVVLFPLKWHPFGPALISILENSEIIKAGVAVHDDIRFLSKIVPFCPQNIVDLSDVAKRNEVESRSLRGLAAAFLHLRISKSEQCSNWGNKEFTPRQVRYAATDAWSSRKIYLAMLQAGFDLSFETQTPIYREGRLCVHTRRKPLRSAP